MPRKKQPNLDKAYLTLSDLYEHFPDKEEVPLEQYKLILKTFNYTMVKSMIEEGKVYLLPNKLGALGIMKQRVFGRGVFDYNLYKKEGIKVWKKNLHSSSYAARFTWDQRVHRTVLTDNIYKWDPPRDWKRELAKQIKENNTISLYYDIYE